MLSLPPPFPALKFMAMSSSSCAADSSLNSHRHGSSVAVRVAITAVAGVALAAAVGGTLLYSRRSHLKRRRKKRFPLTRQQWRNCFDTESGRLISEYKLWKKIRFGGIEPSIRAEVWPFLFGFYEVESTRAEREAENSRKREVYEDLKEQCNLLREKSHEESSEDERTGYIETGSEDSGSPSSEVQTEASEEVPMIVHSSEVASCRENREGISKPEFSSMGNGQTLTKGEKSSIRGSCLKATEDFVTWQRIIRLDAVRMNAEWVPHSPTQANVTGKLACELATSVGLKDDEHLEPCRQHHAARLVAILEAYALYDPETGYCQGMSDLLSPFVALLDNDYEAFWCFAQFMESARHNFRLDEVGIRRQLNKVSNILKLGDPQFYGHLEKVHAQDCTFVYRMVVVLLRRELSFEQTIALWEVIWAEKRSVGLAHPKTSWRKARSKTPSTNDLLLYVITAAVRQRRKIIIERCRGMDDVLRECNSMAGDLDVWTLLDDARELVSTMHGRVSD